MFIDKHRISGKRSIMKQMRTSCFALGMVIFFFGTICADTTETHFPIYRMSGYAGLEIGQIVNGSYFYNNLNNLTTITKAWQERFLFQFINDIAVTERIRMVMNIEGQISFSYPQVLNPPESEAPRYLFFPQRAEGMYTLGDREKPYLQFGMGLFPYKFDPDATNLGEFIFRTGTYPVYLISNFNHCYGELLGLRVSSTLFGSLRQDLMMTSETLMFPTQDYSLSYCVHYSPARCLDIGAGISFAHLFSIEGKLTKGTSFQEGLYQPNPGDTTHVYYSFAGTKPAFMLAFDPKQFFPEWGNVFGKNDGRIYGEICVSGLENRKNYDTAIPPEKDYYNNILDRTMAMVGFKVPTCKVFDDLSLEFEYFPPRYPDSWREVFDENIPVPFTQDSRPRLPWKVSVYAKKTFLHNFFIVGQVARDHMRPTFPDLKNMEREDVLNGINDWWWVVSLNFLM